MTLIAGRPRLAATTSRGSATAGAAGAFATG